jgi:hypothetical protein
MQTSSVLESFGLYLAYPAKKARAARLCRQSTGEKCSGLPALQNYGNYVQLAEMVRSVYDECHVFSERKV